MKQSKQVSRKRYRWIGGVVDEKFLRFLLVGVVNTLFGSAIMFLLYNCWLIRYGTAGYWVASAANYLCASVLSYFLNKHFTFRSREKGPRVALRFALNITVCYLLAYGAAKPLAAWIFRGLGEQLQTNLAMLCGMGFFVILNYLGQRFFAFRVKNAVQPDPGGEPGMFHHAAPAKNRRVLLIINPAAGMAKPKGQLYAVIEGYAKSGCTTTTMTTTARVDAARFVAEKGDAEDLVVCCGGDGTLNEVITGMMQLPEEKRVPIGFIPAGSTNDMARSLRLPYWQMRKCMKLTLSGIPRPYDVGLFNDTVYFNYVCSFGAFTRVSYATPRWLKRLLGHFAYVLDGIASIGEIRPYHMKITVDNEVIEDDFIYGGVTNSLSIAGLVRLKESDVALNDGLFEVMLIKRPSTPAQLQQILNGVLRQRFDDRYVRLLHTSKIIFSAQEPVAWTVDGEFGGSVTEAKIQNLHGAVRLVRR